MNDYVSFLKMRYEPDFFFTTQEFFDNYCTANPNKDISFNAIQSALTRICSDPSNMLEKCGIGEYHYLFKDYIPQDTIVDFLHKEYQIKFEKYDFIYSVSKNDYVYIASPANYELVSLPSSSPNLKALHADSFSIDIIRPKLEMTAQNWTSILLIELLYSFDRYYSRTDTTNLQMQRRPLDTFIKLIHQTKKIRTARNSIVPKKALWAYFTNILMFCEFKSEILLHDGDDVLKRILDDTFSYHDLVHYFRDFSNLISLRKRYKGQKASGKRTLYSRNATELLEDFGLSLSFQDRCISYIGINDPLHTEEGVLPFVFLRSKRR